MSDERIGWGGQFWLSSDDSEANLVKMVKVTGFGLPDDQADEVEVTHLESPGKRKEFIRGLLDGGEVQVSISYIPRSATDVAIRNARDAGDVRAVRFIIPDEDGTADHQIDTSAFVKGYARGPLAAGEKIESTVTLRITGAQSEEAAA